MSTEMITLAVQTADVGSLPLVTDIQYLEPFTSQSLNRKFCGVVRAGVFRGFSCRPAEGLMLEIAHDSNQTGETVPYGVALVERDDYLLTVRQQHTMLVGLTAGQTSYVVVEAFFQHGVRTSQVDANSNIEAASIKVLTQDQVQSHHVILCVVTIPSGATTLTMGNLNFDERKAGGYDLDSHLADVHPHKQYILNNADSSVSANVTFKDNFKLKLGNSGDLSLFHSGSSSYVDNITGSLYLRENVAGGSLFVQAKNSAGTLVNGIALVGGANPYVQLFFGGSVKLATDAEGISVTGKIKSTGEIYENGQRVFSPNNRNISDSVSGTSTTIYASQKSVKTAFDRAVSAENTAKSYADGIYTKLLGDAPQEALDTLTELAQQLNDDANALSAINNTLATKADKAIAIGVTGALTGGGTLGANFTIGVKTATTSQAGVVQLSSSVSSTSTAYAATAYAVKQAYDLAASKLDANEKAVDSNLLDGIDSTQFLRSDVADVKTAGNLVFNDNVRLALGTSSDASIYHSGSHAYLDNNTGTIAIRAMTAGNRVSLQAKGTTGAIYDAVNAKSSGENVYGELLYNGSTRLSTIADGVSIIGSIRTTLPIYEDGQRLYSPSNKPTWVDVGGNSYFTKDGAGFIVPTQWIRAYNEDRGILPATPGQGADAVSWIGNSTWWFKESWVNSYRGGSLSVTRDVTSGANVRAKGVLSSEGGLDSGKHIVAFPFGGDGDAIFGTSTDGANAKNYITINKGKFMFKSEDDVARTVYHTGNKPTPAAIGAPVGYANISDGTDLFEYLKTASAGLHRMGSNIVNKPAGATSWMDMIVTDHATGYRTAILTEGGTRMWQITVTPTGVVGGGWKKIYSETQKPDAFDVDAVPTNSQVLNTSTDWNTLDTTAFYNVYQRSGVVFDNAPAGADYGTLQVIGLGRVGGSFVTQIYTRRIDGAQWVRTRNDGAFGWFPWKRVYSEAFKPTPADVGALPIGGGTLTGTVWTSATYSLVRESTSDNQGFYMDANRTIVGGAGSGSGGIILRPLGIKQGSIEVQINTSGHILELGKRVYSPNNKPTPSDIDAIAATPDLISDPDALIISGKSSITRLGSSYTGLEGDRSLITMPNGSGGFQFAARSTGAEIHVRGAFSNSGELSPWYQLYTTGFKPTAADVKALPTAGGTLTGTVNHNQPTPDDYSFIRLPTYARGSKTYLRKFRGGSSDTVWHEVVQGNRYKLSSGSTDSLDVLVLGGSSAEYLGSEMLDANNAALATTRSDAPIGSDLNAYPAILGNNRFDYRIFRPDAANSPASVSNWSNGMFTMKGYLTEDAYAQLSWSAETGDLYFRAKKVTDAVRPWGRVYTTQSKPTWADVGGDDYWKLGTYITAQNGKWIQAANNATGYIPYSTGNSFLGTSAFVFKESWVNTYRGGAIDITGTVETSSNTALKQTISGTSATLVSMTNVADGGIRYINWGGGLNILSFTKTAVDGSGNAATVNVHGILTEKGQRVYSPNNKPTADDVDALPSDGKAADSLKLNGYTDSATATANSIARRTAAGGLAVVGLTASGDILASGNVTGYSDKRIKTDIQVITNAVERVLALSGVTYQRTDIKMSRQTGLIAQDVQAVLPEAVVENEDGMLSVAYGNMAGLLVQAIKEQQAQIYSLVEEINRLKA